MRARNFKGESVPDIKGKRARNDAAAGKNFNSGQAAQPGEFMSVDDQELRKALEAARVEAEAREKEAQNPYDRIPTQWVEDGFAACQNKNVESDRTSASTRYLFSDSSNTHAARALSSKKPNVSLQR
jgi:hypothetical protein